MPAQTAKAPMVRAVAVALALVTMLLAGLLPSGWTPLARAGSVEMVICTGAGVMTQAVDVGGTDVPAPPTPHGKAEGTCLFAGLGQAGPMPADVASVALALSPTAQPAPPTVPSAVRQTAHCRLPPAQGPPLSV